EPHARALTGAQQAAIDLDLVLGGDIEGRGADHLAVDGHAAVLDPQFRIAARAQPGAGDDLGKAIAVEGGRSIGHLSTPAGPLGSAHHEYKEAQLFLSRALRISGGHLGSFTETRSPLGARQTRSWVVVPTE